MKALVFDPIHGGDIISEHLIAEGYEVTCVDVYKRADPGIRRRVEEMGAMFCEETPDDRYDLFASPCHCPDGYLNGAEYDSRCTFSQAVNRFIDDGRFRIEVTGVKGKTSLCYLLAHTLDLWGRRVFLHTSRGQGPYRDGGHRIDALKSIAPTSLLTLPDGDYDCMICEVSLGGSGKADIAVITNLVEDYPIAGSSRRASDGKADIISGKANIVERSEEAFWRSRGAENAIPYGGGTRIVSMQGIGSPLELELDYMGETMRASFGDGFLGIEYMHAIEAVLTICEHLGVPSETVLKSIESFRGVPGRGEVERRGEGWTVVERNPGISHISIGNTLRCIRGMGAAGRVCVYLDPASRRVCDKLDRALIEKVVESYEAELRITDGCDHSIDIPDDVETAVVLIKEGYQ